MVVDMNTMREFRNPDFGEVRTLAIDGDPWFVGKDVAAALGYSDPYGALRKHVDPEDKQNCQNDSFETPRGMTIINESGLYSLILSSKLPTAKKFKRWVTAEVLPEIRRTGGYRGQEADSGRTLRIMEELMAARAENAALRLEAAQRETEELRRQLEDMQEEQDAKEHRRQVNRERQRRYREKHKQGGQMPT